MSKLEVGNLYIGTKVIKAKPMTRAEYSAHRGWELPADEDGADAGYLVEYTDGGRPNHPNHKGYISWSPADVFERAYRPSSKMTFGQAIEALKVGYRVARTGWNGKGMWIALSPGYELPAQHAKPSHAAYHLAVEQPDGPVRLGARIDMKAADGSLVIGWLASQTDMLAEDGAIVI